MHNRFAPQSILTKYRRQQAALFLVVVITPLMLFQLTASVYATEEHVWNTNTDFATGVKNNTTFNDDGAITLSPTASTTETNWNDLFGGNGSPDTGYNRTATLGAGDIEISQSYAYTEDGSIPLVGSAGRDVFTEGNITYVCSWKGLTAIDTKGTFTNPDDDTLVGYYSTSSTPGILPGGNTSFCNKVGDLIYMGDWTNGLYVFDTHGTVTFSDDTLLTRYYTGSTPALTSSAARRVQLDGNYLYIPLYYSGGLSVIDTKGTLTAADDTLAAHYDVNSYPGLISDNVSSINKAGNILYVGGYTNGVRVFDTNNTATGTDDTALGDYNHGRFSEIPVNFFVNVIKKNNNVLYLGSSRGGLFAIDTKGTQTLADDTLLKVYNKSIDARLADQVMDVTFSGNYLNISGVEAYVTLDTKGTLTPEDDEVTTYYNNQTNPTFVADGMADAVTANGLIYTSSWAPDGLTAITKGVYRPQGLYQGLPRRIGTVPTSTISLDSTIASGQDVVMQYRTGSPGAAWREDFATTSSYAADLYNWGSLPDAVGAAGGILTATTSHRFDFWVATGYPVDHFIPGSTITARVRINNPDPSKPVELYMFTDDWWSDDFTTKQNEWITLKLTLSQSDAFSNLGFDLYTTGTYPANASIQVDWIEVTTPDSMGQWGAWSAACPAHSCVLPNLSAATWLQYRLALSTTNTSTTPVVHSVSYNDAYYSTGTYQSSIYTFEKPRELSTFVADVTTPIGTSIAFEYSIDGGTVWKPISPGQQLSHDDIIASSFMWRATLATTNGAYTPTINSVSIIASPYTKTTGTLVAGKATSLDRSGESAAVIMLRREHPEFFNGKASKEQIQEKVVTLLAEVVVHITSWFQLWEVVK